MSKLSYLEKLLNGAEVEWKSLGDVVDLQRGRRLVKSQLETSGKYAVYQNSMTPLGYYHDCNVAAQSSFIICAGAAGEIGYSEDEFWAADDVHFAITPEYINGRFLFHFLLTQKNKISGQVRRASIPRLSKSVLEKLEFPIPSPDNPEKSLAIQSEIVRILDKFTALTTELTAELTARKKQYNYYCDQLLNFDEDIPVVPLSDCCVSISDGDHQAPPKTDSGVPFITISNVTPSNTIDFENTYFVADDYYQRIHDKRRARKKDILYTVVGSIGIPVYIDFDMKFAFQRHIAILRTDEQKIIPKYLYHVMRSSAFLKKANSVAVGAAQKTITLSALNKMNVPIPPIGEQERIVNILDKFDTLANSLSEGLPREIDLRQKQYEYYRDMLFSFPIPEEPEA